MSSNCIDCRVRQHVEWLVEHNLTYHFDDHPDDIRWNPYAPPTLEQLDEIRDWHTLIWSTPGFNIWDFFDRHPDLSDRWSAL